MGLLPCLRLGDVSLTGQQPHVIAFNTWRSEGAPPPPPNSIGVCYFTIVLPKRMELNRVGERVQQAGGTVEQTQEGLMVRDPSQIGIVLAAGSNPADLAMASGVAGPLSLPYVVGAEGVGQLADGRRVYFEHAVAPFGSFAL